MVPLMHIDEIDRGIIVELQSDGRRPLREVARNLGIAEATVRLRLKRLQDEGILQFIAFADPTKLGPSVMALFFITSEPDFHDAVIAHLQGLSEVTYLSTTLGDADICAQVVCADAAALWSLQQLTRRLKGVSRVRVISEIEVHKIRFVLPADSITTAQSDIE